MKLTVCLGIVGLVLAACGGGTTQPPTSAPGAVSTTTTTPPNVADDARAELEAARARWSAAGLDTYSYVFRDDCGECDPSLQIPRDVVVWDGDQLDATRATPTIDEMFAEIEAAIAAGVLDDVVYDPASGVPTEVSIDMASREVDGGTHWTIDALTPDLPGDDVVVAEVDAAWELWKTHRPEAYSYVVSVICDCQFDGTLYTEVDGDDIIDWDVVFDTDNDAVLSPMTMDRLFGDVRDLVAAGEEGFGDGDATFEGSARFDPHLGYPSWIGVNVTATDGTLETLGLPERIVFAVSAVKPLTESQRASGTGLERARSRWESRSFGDSYAFDMTVHDVVTADFHGPYEVRVVDGRIVNVTLNGDAVDLDAIPLLTIDDLFDLAEAHASTQDFEMLFHASLGYPVLVPHGDEVGGLIAVANVVAIP